MSKPTIKSLTDRLDKVTCEKDYIINEQLKRIRQLEGSPKIREQLNMANATVAELMKEVEALKDRNINSSNLLNIEINGLQHTINQLKSDYALLDEKYYTQSDNYTELNKQCADLIYKNNKLTAENHSLILEIERTNRHINLAENQLHKEQQPLVVNHYHNCTINKCL